MLLVLVQTCSYYW